MVPMRVREMDKADIAAVAAIRVRGWQAAYEGIVPRTYLDAMTVDGAAAQLGQFFAQPRRQSRHLVALAGGDDNGGPMGWICFGPCRNEMSAPGPTGEVYALYVAPDLIGRGIGSSLLEEAHAQLRSQGFAASALWVLAENRQARRFYERADYQADGATQDDVYDEATLTEVRYSRAL
ncbi:GNAT family N-acetyltransferase [Streptomyces sp. NPDC004732]|uniref:GNAT family N-acetyltransferase n=1 Tax=Streptomyces sp. NPDC004732 TaxID=3154290 RepID=UPI0033ABE1AF